MKIFSSPFFPLVMPMAYIVENNMLDEVANDVELVCIHPTAKTSYNEQDRASEV